MLVLLETPRCLPVFPSGTVFCFRDVAGILRIVNSSCVYGNTLFLCYLWYSLLMCFDLGLTSLHTEAVVWKGNKV